MENLYPGKHRPRIFQVQKIVKETPEIKSIYFNAPEISSSSEPGQYIMVWVIGLDEIPMAVSTTKENKIVGFTVEKVGKATSKLHELEKDNLIGIRGPYGNGFDLSGEKILIIGGGCGMAPLMFAFEEAVDRGKSVKVITTAKTADKILFKSRLENQDVELVIGTEDGSAGIEGITTDVIKKSLNRSDYDTCLLCGPEKMITASAELIKEKEIPIQVSLERYLKCGIGICGSCSLDPSGLRVCKEGPVFRYEEVKNSELGVYKRDSTGKKTKIQ